MTRVVDWHRHIIDIQHFIIFKATGRYNDSITTISETMENKKHTRTINVANFGYI